MEISKVEIDRTFIDPCGAPLAIITVILEGNEYFLPNADREEMMGKRISNAAREVAKQL